MICREYCDRVALVDDASELEPAFFAGITDVGITAGASTPAWIIKEVNKTMSEITNVEAVQEENFAELLEQSIKTLNTGDKVVGTVTGIGNTEVQVDLGTKHAGYIPYDEVSTDPSVKPEDVLKVGDEIEVFGEHQLIETAAKQCGTISYELLCAVSKRVPRYYYLGGKCVDRNLQLLG